MLKAEVTLSGVINRAAVAGTAKDGRNYTTFGVAVTLMQRNGEQSRFDISVSMDAQPFDAPSFTEGQRVDLTGELVFKKRGDAFYLNLYAKSATPSATTTDSLTGKISFRGALGKNIESRADKKGNPMLIFSGYSAEKVGEGFEYVWVRFVAFKSETQPWMQPKAKFEATGDLEMWLFAGKPSISCRVEEMKEYIKPPYNP